MAANWRQPCLLHQPPAFDCQQSHTFEKLKICCDVEVQTNLLRLRVLYKSVHGNFVVFHMTKLKLIQVDDNRKCNKNCRRRKLKCFPGCPLDAVACWGLGQGVRPPAGHRLLTAAAFQNHQLRHMQPNTNTKTNTNTHTKDNHHHHQGMEYNYLLGILCWLLLQPTTTTITNGISCVTCNQIHTGEKSNKCNHCDFAPSRVEQLAAGHHHQLYHSN